MAPSGLDPFEIFEGLGEMQISSKSLFKYCMFSSKRGSTIYTTFLWLGEDLCQLGIK